MLTGLYQKQSKPHFANLKSEDPPPAHLTTEAMGVNPGVNAEAEGRGVNDH